MPVTETEHLQRIESQRLYRETAALPEDERIALPPQSNLPSPRQVAVIESICPRCGACCESPAVTFRCRCGKVHDRVWG